MAPGSGADGLDFAADARPPHQRATLALLQPNAPVSAGRAWVLEDSPYRPLQPRYRVRPNAPVSAAQAWAHETFPAGCSALRDLLLAYARH